MVAIGRAGGEAVVPSPEIVRRRAFELQIEPAIEIGAKRDIALAPYAYRWFNLELERPAADNLRAWYDRIAARPAFRDHVMLPLS